MFETKYRYSDVNASGARCLGMMPAAGSRWGPVIQSFSRDRWQIATNLVVNTMASSASLKEKALSFCRHSVSSPYGCPCLGERGEDGDAAGWAGGVLHVDGRVAVYRGCKDGRETLASLGRRVRAAVLGDRRRRGKIRQLDVELLFAMSPEVSDPEQGCPSGQLADVVKEGLLLERVRLVVGSEWHHHPGNLEEIARVISFRLNILSPERFWTDVGLFGFCLTQCAHSSASVACAILVGEEKLESPLGLYSISARLKSDASKEFHLDDVSAVCRPITLISLATVTITDTTAQICPYQSAVYGSGHSYQPA